MDAQSNERVELWQFVVALLQRKGRHTGSQGQTDKRGRRERASGQKVIGANAMFVCCGKRQEHRERGELEITGRLQNVVRFP